MFQLSKKETENLIAQLVIAKPDGQGGRRFAPHAFTEQGMAMLSSVLRSQRAVQVNVAIMQTFVRLREMLSWHEELRRKLMRWKSATTPDFKRFSKPSGRCWRLRFLRKNPLDFTPPSNCRRSPASPAVTNVNNRKQISYLPQGQLFGLEKTGHFGYTFVVVDSQKIPTNRHVHQGIQA